MPNSISHNRNCPFVILWQYLFLLFNIPTHLSPLFHKSRTKLSWKIKTFPPMHMSRIQKSLSRVRLFATPWSVVHQAPLSMGFSRQEYWSGLPFPSPGDLPNPGITPRSPTLQADALTSEPPGKPLEYRSYPEKRSEKNAFMFIWGLNMILAFNAQSNLWKL